MLKLIFARIRALLVGSPGRHRDDEHPIWILFVR